MSAQDYEGQRFEVTITQLGSGWSVHVDAGDNTTAELVAPDVDLALAMAVPFMRAVAAPVPLSDDEFARFERALRGPSAPDGPREAGQ